MFQLKEHGLEPGQKMGWERAWGQRSLVAQSKTCEAIVPMLEQEQRVDFWSFSGVQQQREVALPRTLQASQYMYMYLTYLT